MHQGEIGEEARTEGGHELSAVMDDDGMSLPNGLSLWQTLETNSKRPIDDIEHNEVDQSSVKRRKALQDLEQSDSRTNILAAVFEVPVNQHVHEVGKLVHDTSTNPS